MRVLCSIFREGAREVKTEEKWKSEYVFVFEIDTINMIQLRYRDRHRA